MLREMQWELVKWECAPVAPPSGDLGNWDGKTEKGMGGKGAVCRNLQAVAKMGFIPRKGALGAGGTQRKKGSWLDLGERKGGMSQRGEFRTQNTGSGAVVLTKRSKFAISHSSLSMDTFSCHG